jgi:excisionase family DNA binding protein
MMIQNKAYMNTTEAASYLGVCSKSIGNYRRQGLIPTVFLGGRRIFRRDDLDEAMESLRTYE